MAELSIKRELLTKVEGEDGGLYDVQWFELTGRVNTTTAEDFEKEMNKALKEGSYITINMSKVTLLTSVGIRVILKTFKQCDATHGKFLLEDPSQPVQNVLGLSALEQMLK